MGDRTGGRQQNCNGARLQMPEFHNAIFVICLIGLGEGYLWPRVICLHWLSCSKATVSRYSLVGSCWNDAMGRALGCPQMLSAPHMMNVSSDTLYLRAPLGQSAAVRQTRGCSLYERKCDISPRLDRCLLIVEVILPQPGGQVKVAEQK